MNLNINYLFVSILSEIWYKKITHYFKSVPYLYSKSVQYQYLIWNIVLNFTPYFELVTVTYLRYGINNFNLYFKLVPIPVLYLNIFQQKHIYSYLKIQIYNNHSLFLSTLFEILCNKITYYFNSIHNPKYGVKSFNIFQIGTVSNII